MQIHLLIHLCCRMYSILDSEHLEEFVRREANRSKSSAGLYLIYQSYRVRTKSWADVEYDRLMVDQSRRHIIDNYLVEDDLVVQLSAILGDIETDTRDPLEQRVINAIRDRGLFAEALSAGYESLMAQMRRF